MRYWKAILAAAFLPCAASALVQPIEAAPAAVDYGDPARWLCRPGRDDACARPLPTARLEADAYGAVGQSVPAAEPPADCFYVYPTVSRDPGENSDMLAGPEEQAVAAVQFGRFASVCRTFAPIYRQATLASLQKSLAGADFTSDFTRGFETAYQDVLAAWRHYLEHDNKGRPFVLIGHSQGSIMLSMLLAREIENKPVASLMLSAMLIGYNIEVPEGKAVGGTFANTPLCRRATETGCVVTYVSFRATNPPPAASLFGRSVRPGMTVACTNPAGLGRGSVPLDSIWYAGALYAGLEKTISWSSTGAPPAQFLRTEGLVSAACVNRGPAGYLAVTVNADPNDARTDRIPGDVVVGGDTLTGWGLHIADMSLAMGDLLALVETQSAAWHREARRR